jgi:K+-sensing histidine kinase KdpD
MRFTPIFQPNSQEVAGVMITGVDVTEQIRGRDALIEANSRLSTLRKIDTELTAQLDLVYVEQTALRYSVEESDADRGFLVLVDGDRLEVKAVLGYETPNPLTAMNEQEIRQVLADGRALHRTLNGRAANGSVKSNDGLRLVLPLVYADQPRGALVLERKHGECCDEDTLAFVKSIAVRATAALENARLYAHLNQLYERVSTLEQLKTDMIRIAAHDLRNPLTALKGYLTLLEADLQETITSRQSKYLTMLEESAQAMQRIISEILSLQRIEAIHNNAEVQSVDLAALIKELHQRHHALAAQKRITLRRGMKRSFGKPSRT